GAGLGQIDLLDDERRPELLQHRSTDPHAQTVPCTQAATPTLKSVLQRPMLPPVTRVRLLTAFACTLLLCALPDAAGAKPIRRSRWLPGVAVTEYYPVPEAWFVGKKVAAPGLSGKHRIDWLYSATG